MSSQNLSLSMPLRGYKFVISLTRLKDYLTSTTEVSVTADEQRNIAMYCTHLTALISYLRQQLRQWEVYLERFSRQSASMAYSLPLRQTSPCGRPKFEISRDQLEYLHSMMFNWTKIAAMLGVSRATIYRRRIEVGLSGSGDESNITDQQLESILRVMRRETPTIGQTMAIGKLRSMGIRVSRNRVRSCIRAIDPISTALRWRGQLARRQPYSVPGPNSLWHLGKLTAILNTIHISLASTRRYGPFCAFKCT